MGFLKGTMVSFTTIHGPLRRQAAGRRPLTWRELQAVHICLSSFSRSLAGCTVQWFTDNRNIASIICNGNLKRDLHELAFSIFRLVLWNTIDLRVGWVPRSLNKHARGCHYQVHCLRWLLRDVLTLFSHVDGLSGAHILCIGFPNSHKFLNRFYSRCWNPVCERVDAFCYDWVGENNWLVSPVSLVPRVIRNLVHCKAVGTLIVLEWVFVPFLARALRDQVSLPFPCQGHHYLYWCWGECSMLNSSACDSDSLVFA